MIILPLLAKTVLMAGSKIPRCVKCIGFFCAPASSYFILVLVLVRVRATNKTKDLDPTSGFRFDKKPFNPKRV